MKCLVTAGPTYEPLDEVRRLTNFSTGRLGSALAAFLTARGWQVVLLLSSGALVRPEEAVAAEVEIFTTTQDLADRLARRASPEISAVFHAAAVSDFSFGQVVEWDVQGGSPHVVDDPKLSTRRGHLYAELVPTPKVIRRLREWFPRARLSGWKYELAGNREAIIRRGMDQLRECGTQLCVLNGRAYGEGFGVLDATGRCRHAADREALFAALDAWGRSQPAFTGTHQAKDGIDG